jgi:hypothetical protein
MFEGRDDIAPDILFTHCGGKSRMKVVVDALRALNVPVVAIPDFDIINNKQEFKLLVEAFGIDWSAQVDTYMQTIYDWLNANPHKKNEIKRSGKNALDGEAPAKYETVERVNCLAGLFVVPVGEIECFDKTINKEKKDWIYEIISRGNLSHEQKLSTLRDFIKTVIAFQ